MSKELFKELSEDEIYNLCINANIKTQLFSNEHTYTLLLQTYEGTTLVDDYVDIAQELKHVSAKDYLSGAGDILKNRQDIILLKMDIHLLKRENHCK